MNQLPAIIANWKLGLDHEQSVILANKISNSQSELTQSADIILCPSSTSLQAVHDALGDNSQVRLGGQDMHSEELGAFTGETSILSLKQLGASYVILGHSERRKHFHETNEQVNLKVKLALKHGMTPIVCIGETYEDRQAQQAEIVVTRELDASLKGVDISPDQKIIVAYEPIWAIGTGQAINPDQAKMMGMVIHQQLIDTLSEQQLQQFHVIYGGSVDAENIQEFVDGRVLQGVLVGGASQDFQKFSALVKAIENK